MVQIMWDDMVQYTFNFHKDLKLLKLFLEYICVFEYVVHYIHFHKYTLISHL
jgi:hypothetical protein